MTGKEKSARVDLGLAISGATLAPGQTRSYREIAAFCNCHWSAIWHIEVKALKKLLHRARFLADELTDLNP